MSTPRMAVATPSPPPNLHSPPTPRLGFADSWEPFSPRKSSRLSSKSAASSASASVARTPSPSGQPRHNPSRPFRSPRTTTRPGASFLDPVSFSPAPTPRKKRMPASALSPESAPSKKMAAAAAANAHLTSMTMLPTPAKTPSKKAHAASQNESNIAAIARNLFHTNDADVDEVMSSPSAKKARRAKKYTGISLESFTVVEEEESIPIFTDSQDRVPEADLSNDNPFYGSGAAPSHAEPASPVRRRSKRSLVSIPGEGRQTVEDATRREDGLVYVFRGKKIFRKFEDSSAAQEEDILEGVAPGGRRLTRSAIKPRLLFPREEIKQAAIVSRLSGSTTEDEEAVTDIEDGNEELTDAMEEEEADQPISTPTNLVHGKAPSTPPRAPRFAPSTPPTMARTTRSAHKAAVEAAANTGAEAAAEASEATPTARNPRLKKRSPFESWRQTKSSGSNSSGSVAGHKRSAEDAMPAMAASASKRTRGA